VAEREQQLSTEAAAAAAKALASSEEAQEHARTAKFHQVGVLGLNCMRVGTLETAQGQIDGFFSQLPLKIFLLEVVSVGD